MRLWCEKNERAVTADFIENQATEGIHHPRHFVGATASVVFRLAMRNKVLSLVGENFSSSYDRSSIHPTL